jgi:hypothetical protein
VLVTKSATAIRICIASPNGPNKPRASSLDRTSAQFGCYPACQVLPSLVGDKNRWPLNRDFAQLLNNTGARKYSAVASEKDGATVLCGNENVLRVYCFETELK